ncbi:uncharacterized protein RCC_10836 [Ramularia collo-cygni]|uniref:Uncharacterized protein n=1 Tax=Ramularia collo-cygni TaxID=112498 RepID=A0A2D3V486_9PEZI|nr:uncharacterized protein RCC_10836 [Ramularia collo-cygni]CZT25107.1 uncharacterized protein RCC_10836 [Ramularia collo-cygni]
MHALSDLLSQYPILTSLSSFISTLDLHHLATASQACRLPIERNFDTLKRNCLCDGRGLALRHNFSGPYSIIPGAYTWGNTRKLWQDEPIEVRLWKTVCDSTNALPCQKCNVGICEECRYYPREEPRSHYPKRRPHLNSSFESENIICLCPKCDAEVEQELQGRYLNVLCDCDVYKRWVCWKCVREEQNFSGHYYHDHTVLDADSDETKSVHDHQFTRDVRCQLPPDLGLTC